METSPYCNSVAGHRITTIFAHATTAQLKRHVSFSLKYTLLHIEHQQTSLPSLRKQMQAIRNSTYRTILSALFQRMHFYPIPIWNYCTYSTLVFATLRQEHSVVKTNWPSNTIPCHNCLVEHSASTWSNIIPLFFGISKPLSFEYWW